MTINVADIIIIIVNVALIFQYFFSQQNVDYKNKGLMKMNDVLKEIAVIYGAGFGTGVAVVFFCEQVLSIVREILADLKNKKG